MVRAAVHRVGDAHEVRLGVGLEPEGSDVLASARIAPASLPPTARSLPVPPAVVDITNAPVDPSMDIQVGTHQFHQEYLFAFAPAHEVLVYVRFQAAEEDRKRSDQMMAAWSAVQPRVQGLVAAPTAFCSRSASSAWMFTWEPLAPPILGKVASVLAMKPLPPSRPSRRTPQAAVAWDSAISTPVPSGPDPRTPTPGAASRDTRCPSARCPLVR